MLNSDYILWVGSLFSQSEMEDFVAVSAAANEWSYRFIYQLYLRGERVVTLGHQPEPYWPKGRLLIDGDCDNGGKINLFHRYRVSYYNLPFARNKILTSGYLKCFKKKVAEFGFPKAVFAYNLYPYSYVLCSYLKNKYKIPCFVILADSPTKDAFRSIEEHDTRLKNTDGVAVLSYGYYKNIKNTCNAIHFEGGVTHNIEDDGEDKRNQKSDKIIIVYTGSRSTHSGYYELIDSMKYVQSPNVELWLAGPGIALSSKQIDSDVRIKDYGFLNKSDLDKMMRKADFFISPYSIDHKPNEYNFPSKILLYLGYGKPIISTVTPGLSPEYKSVLCLLSDNNPKTIAEKIDELSCLSDFDREDMSKKVMDLVLNNKAIDKQVDRFMNWVEDTLTQNRYKK